MTILRGMSRIQASHELRRALSYTRMPRDLRSPTAIHTVTAPFSPDALHPAALSLSAFVASQPAHDAVHHLLDLAETYEHRCQQEGVARHPDWAFVSDAATAGLRQWQIARDENYCGYRFAGRISEWRPGEEALYFQDGRLVQAADQAALADATGLRDLRHEVQLGVPIPGVTRWHLSELAPGARWSRSLSVYWGPHHTTWADAELQLEGRLGLTHVLAAFPQGIRDARKDQMLPFVRHFSEDIVRETGHRNASMEAGDSFPLELAHVRPDDAYVDNKGNWFVLSSSVTLSDAPLLRVWGHRVFDLSDPTRIGWHVGMRLLYTAAQPDVSITFNQLWGA